LKKNFKNKREIKRMEKKEKNKSLRDREKEGKTKNIYFLPVSFSTISAKRFQTLGQVSALESAIILLKSMVRSLPSSQTFLPPTKTVWTLPVAIPK